jgi:hypothetical protein
MNMFVHEPGKHIVVRGDLQRHPRPSRSVREDVTPDGSDGSAISITPSVYQASTSPIREASEQLYGKRGAGGWVHIFSTTASRHNTAHKTSALEKVDIGILWTELKQHFNYVKAVHKWLRISEGDLRWMASFTVQTQMLVEGGVKYRLVLEVNIKYYIKAAFHGDILSKARPSC